MFLPVETPVDAWAYITQSLSVSWQTTVDGNVNVEVPKLTAVPCVIVVPDTVQILQAKLPLHWVASVAVL